MTRRQFAALITAGNTAERRCWVTLDLLRASKNIRWPGAENPVNMGSLLKPFLVLAYGATHPHYPVTYCGGTKDGCWLARGHGSQDIISALANSCNVYFLSLSAAIDRAALDSVCLSYGLSGPHRDATGRALIGLGSGWPQSPLVTVNAFARLLENRRTRNVEIVLAGMARCAQLGTARAIGLDCFAKTGTAPCTHAPHAPGDGFVVALYPRPQPRAVTLFVEHGVPGAEAARALLRKID